jgi:hypothetical protein
MLAMGVWSFCCNLIISGMLLVIRTGRSGPAAGHVATKAIFRNLLVRVTLLSMFSERVC